MDRLEAMWMLSAVAERGGFSAAGRALNVPLATLSRKISDLEALLGTRLLVRTTRKVTLTDAGVVYVAAARRILEQVEDAEREAAGEFTAPRGELVVTAPTMFGRIHVLPVVADFLAKFPEIRVRLLLSDKNLDLAEEHVDMAVRIGRLPDSSMVATQIGTMRTVTCASPSLIDSHGVPQRPEDLLRIPCVGLDAPVPSPGWRYRSPETGATIDIEVEPRLSVTSKDAAVQAAVTTVGIVRLLHYQVAHAVSRGRLRIILDAFEPEPSPVNLLHLSRGLMPLKMRQFHDFAVPRLREAVSAVADGVAENQGDMYDDVVEPRL
jgi:DNA-binding transcriptional LysR family regulator